MLTQRIHIVTLDHEIASHNHTFLHAVIDSHPLGEPGRWRPSTIHPQLSPKAPGNPPAFPFPERTPLATPLGSRLEHPRRSQMNAFTVFKVCYSKCILYGPLAVTDVFALARGYSLKLRDGPRPETGIGSCTWLWMCTYSRL